MADAIERITHLLRNLIACAAQQSCDFTNGRLLRFDQPQRTLARDRLDTTDTRSDTALGQNLEEPDVTRTTDVRATTELHRKITDTQHANA